MSSSCPFCDILTDTSHPQREELVSLETHVYAKLSDPRLVPGHLLIIPKRHVSSLTELPRDELHQLFEVAVEYWEYIAANSGGCELKCFPKPFLAGTEAERSRRVVPHHIHVHLLPRSFNDELYERVQIHETPLFQKLSSEERNLFLRKYRN